MPEIGLGSREYCPLIRQAQRGNSLSWPVLLIKKVTLIKNLVHHGVVFVTKTLRLIAEGAKRPPEQAGSWSTCRPRRALQLTLVSLWAWGAAGISHAHGGVVLEGDLCVIEVGFYRAHFTIFQPRIRGHEEYCEDLPEAHETVFVLEYLHDGLERIPVDLRIIRNVTGLGRFAREADIDAIEDLEAQTVFYQSPVVEPDVFAVLHEFTAPGEYIGIVTATHESGERYTAVFPFEVGAVSAWLVAGPLTVLVLGLSGWWFLRRRTALRGLSTPRPVAPLLLTGLLLPALLVPIRPLAAELPMRSHSAAGHFEVTVATQPDPVPVNRMHTWLVTLRNAEGEPVADATIEVTGGMPEHDHGLASSPRMTASLGEGTYRIDGMKFHMNGRWEVVLSISANGVTDIATVHIEL